jgi:hypothetical protein
MKVPNLDWTISVSTLSSDMRKPLGVEGMNKVVQRKKIIIPYSGYIHALGVHGPVEIPYMETLENIAKMLMRRIPVYEITSGGNKVKLTTTNYKKNNGGDGDDVKKTYEPVNAKKKSSTICVSDEDLEEKSLSAILRNSTKKLSKSKDYYENSKHDKKKNKHKGGSESPVYIGAAGSSVDSDLVETK